MNWYKKANNIDEEDAVYLTKTYGSVDAFLQKVNTIKEMIKKDEDVNEAAELTSDRTPEQIVQWLERQKKMATYALKLYEISGAKGPNDKVWSDLDLFGQAWNELV